MGAWLFAHLVSAGASILAGGAAVAALVALGYYRKPDGSIFVRRIGGVFAGGIAAYTYLVCITCNFFLGIPLDTVIAQGFRGDRMAWLFLALMGDLIPRLWDEYRPARQAD